MSSSAWPPQLKTWVQDCLSRATSSNKAAVSAELKSILFKAHADGTVNTTDWNTVQLEALVISTAPASVLILLARLRAQTARQTFTPISVGTVAPPPRPIIPTSRPNLNGSEDGWDNGSAKESAKSKKKRKKNEAATKAFPTPYHFVSDTEQAAALARRAARFQQPSAVASSSNSVGGVDRWFADDGEEGAGGSLGARLGGFEGGMVPAQVGRKRMKGKGGLGYGGEEVMEVDPNVMDWDKHTIKGTCTKLEKSYLRLTSEPSPADIRPLHILQESLVLIKQKWKSEHKYNYALDQLKSMRQDLTVQRIKNDFTVQVYEIHARIALEARDLGEYNQCQSMLRHLYELGIKGHPEEFLSYRIIYLLHTRNRSDMATLLAQLTPKEKSDPGVHHALQVHASLATSNYVRFFRLFESAPNMSGYIMDHFVERERMTALTTMSKSYMSLSLPFITSTLAFDSDEETDSFLSQHSAAVYLLPEPAKQPNTTSHWRPVKAVKLPPLAERVWDCRRAHQACAGGVEKYRVVDLKGQVDSAT
ncbi:SAC3 family protein LENG8/THP3, partial [Tremellales sp. Uapishka_1]